MRDRDPRGPYRGLHLPSGYRSDESEPDVAVLRRPGGTEVAVFSATGADPREIERAAWKYNRERCPFGAALRFAARSPEGPPSGTRVGEPFPEA